MSPNNDTINRKLNFLPFSPWQAKAREKVERAPYNVYLMAFDCGSTRKIEFQHMLAHQELLNGEMKLSIRAENHSIVHFSFLELKAGFKRS